MVLTIWELVLPSYSTHTHTHYTQTYEHSCTQTPPRNFLLTDIATIGGRGFGRKRREDRAQNPVCPNDKSWTGPIRVRPAGPSINNPYPDLILDIVS